MPTWAIACLVAALVGAILNRSLPFPDHSYLVILTHAQEPLLYKLLKWGWTSMLFTTPALILTIVYSRVATWASPGARGFKVNLPPYPKAKDDEPLHVVIGEVHHPHILREVENPEWLCIPVKGLFTGMAVFGSTGAGKTTAALRPFAEQILSWRARDDQHKIGGIVLEVKGDFCHQIRDIMERCDRAEDYVELNMSGSYRYNPLHNNQSAFSLAYSIASLINQLYGHSKEPFWQQAYTNLVKFVIMLHRVVDDYVTLFDVYMGCISHQYLQQKIQQGTQMFARVANARSFATIDPRVYVENAALLRRFTWTNTPEGMRATLTDELRDVLDQDPERMPYDVESPDMPSDPAAFVRKAAEFESVRRWYTHDWMRIDNKLRTSIVEGISVFLSLFDDETMVNLFCPPRECYDPIANADGKYGRPLPSLSDLIETGKVLALNFPIGANPATSRMIACLMKQDFQRMMQDRIPKIELQKDRHWREAMFLCDEYQMLATVGEHDPNGDEKFFALSRQSKCIAIVATQTISSLRSALPGESWRTLLASFRTKLFLTIGDDFSARLASELAGESDQLVPSYSISESGHDVVQSAITGNALAKKTGLTYNKSLNIQSRPDFRGKAFTQLPNTVAIALAHDGTNPLPPTMVCLKPWFNDPNESWFEQKRRRKV